MQEFGIYLKYNTENISLVFIVNVATNKPAYLKNQYRPGDHRYDASNAVDGKKSDLRFVGGQCASSVIGNQTATWWVNLTSIYSIHHITIYFMKSNKAWGMVIIFFNFCPSIMLIIFMFLRLSMTFYNITSYLPE